MIDAGIFRDVFFSPAVHEVLVSGSIISPESDARSLLNALFLRLEAAERLLGEDVHDTSRTLADIADLIRAGVCILGSPLLTNVAFGHPTLSSCSAVPLPKGRFSHAHAQVAASYYGLNMGSGYNLDDSPDPVTLLYDLNAHAQDLTRRRFCERYIGNMAHLSVHHPEIRRFIAAKVDRRDVLHFNISVDVSDAFMAAVEADDAYALWNGAVVQAREVWDALVEAAWLCGDPGLVSLTRLNEGNALRERSPYRTTAPCAEVGLAPGETCVFGYINLAACLRADQEGSRFDETLLTRAVRCLTRILDDAVEDSLDACPLQTTKTIMSRTRKIGIGVCGYADALLLADVEYGSDEACAWLNRALSVIYCASKQASMELSARRGAFGDFERSRYRSEEGFLTRVRARASAPSHETWQALARDVGRWGLRNAMTTALPPSGRSSILLGVNSSIEPYLSFSPRAHAPLLLRILAETGHMVVRPDGSVRNARRPAALHIPARNAVFRRAVDIPPVEHLAVLAEAAALVDDGVSKTVNLARDASVSDVANLYLGAWRAGVKAISVYRDDRQSMNIRAA